MEHTKEKLEAKSSTDESWVIMRGNIVLARFQRKDRPESNEIIAKKICKCVNGWDGLVQENEKLKALCLRESHILQETANRGARHDKSVLRVIADSLYEASQGTLANAERT